MFSLVCCAAAAVEGMASQAGAPPPEAAEALDAGKHCSRNMSDLCFAFCLTLSKQRPTPLTAMFM